MELAKIWKRRSVDVVLQTAASLLAAVSGTGKLAAQPKTLARGTLHLPAAPTPTGAGAARHKISPLWLAIAAPKRCKGTYLQYSNLPPKHSGLLPLCAMGNSSWIYPFLALSFCKYWHLPTCQGPSYPRYTSPVPIIIGNLSHRRDWTWTSDCNLSRFLSLEISYCYGCQAVGIMARKRR